MSVIDASVVVRLLLGLPLSDFAAQHIFDAPEPACAPDHLNAEVLLTIRRYEHRGLIATDRSRRAIDDLLDLRLLRYPTHSLVLQAWRLRANLTAYDALYVALALALNRPLVTADRRLAAAARRHAHVEVVVPGG